MNIYYAALGNLELKIEEFKGKYRWNVKNSRTGEEIGSGEAAHVENAMVGAAEAAQAEWGSLRWYRRGGED